MISRDRIFAKKTSKTTPFQFNQEVASVFDDMVSRSVPFYNEIHRMILDLAQMELGRSALVVDLGCSTGTTLQLIHEHANSKDKNFSFIAVDSSKAMIDKCKKKLRKISSSKIKFKCADLESVEIKNADMVILNYTLQFVAPAKRQLVLEKIVRGLRPGGFLILAEKINTRDKKIQQLTTNLYYDFKRRNGYSELEISQKREALENVLIPWSAEKNLHALKKSGLTNVAMLFKWYNFASFIGYKPC